MRDRDIEKEEQEWEDRQKKLDEMYPGRKRPPYPFFNPKRAGIILAVIIAIMIIVPWLAKGVLPWPF